MDLHNELRTKYMKTGADTIAAWIGDDEDRFAQLMDIYVHGTKAEIQRSAWAMDMVAQKFPGLAAKHIDTIVQRMEQPKLHDAVRRHGARILMMIDMPERIHASVMNLCFDLLADPKQAIAVRCLAMDVLAKLAITYPELKPELIALMENEEQPSAGFISRRNLVMAKLKKIS
ncbi:MAG: hypothetical protein EOP56_11385 [Sphingobacteriales bacterium]|nr:MAG: hypothetical protein EOP56_11385 [Sphingobacteriales bacterium]